MLLLVGGVLLGRTLWTASGEPLRVVATLAVLVVGVALNVVALFERTLALSAWLRGLACSVAVLTAGGALLVRWRLLERVLPTVPSQETLLRDTMRSAAEQNLWLAVALGWIALCVLVLPPREPR